MKKSLSSFEKIIGIKFKNQNLLLQSLTHKSNNPLNNNEKLEFLGDRVLGLIISKNLYKLFPKDLFLKLHHHNIFPFLTLL